MKRFLLIVCTVIFGGLTTLAQDDACPSLVQNALSVVDELCDTTGRNQVCYGNAQLTVTSFSDATRLTFETPGDIADVTLIQDLQLSTMQLPDEWGIALMKIQANLPDSLPGQNVTMLLFGNIFIENQAGNLPAPLPGKITASANLRSGPGTNFSVVGSGANDQDVVVDARNEAGDWFRIILPETDELAWIFQSLITIEGDIESLTVVEVDDPMATSQFGPMQAFYFETGVGDRICSEAPRDGILIQTPSGAGTITIEANGINIELGSTALLTAVPADFFTITLLEGSAQVTADGVSIFVPAGLQAQVPLDENGLANGTPQLLTYEAGRTENLPVSNLDERVEIPEPSELPYTQYAGQWSVGALPAITCPSSSGGVYNAVLPRPAFTFTLNPNIDGLLAGELLYVAVDDSTFVWTTVDEVNIRRTQTITFDGDDNGTFAYTLDTSGYTLGRPACIPVATVSSTMTRE